MREGLKNRLVEVKLRRKEEGAGARPVNIDGKTIRGSGFHMVSAWIEEHGLTLGQLKTEEKSNEIKAAPKLLELLDVRGDVITADAMDCRKDIAQKIREQGADYILAVKENQPTLYGDIKEYFEGMESGDFTAEEFLNYIRGHWSIENQLHWMLDKSLSGRRVSGKDGECGPQFEYTEKDGVTPAEENKNGEETGQRQTPHDARRPGFGLPV